MLWPKRIAVAACVAVAVLLGYRYMPDFTQAPELAAVGEENASGKAAETIEQSGKKSSRNRFSHYGKGIGRHSTKYPGDKDRKTADGSCLYPQPRGGNSGSNCNGKRGGQ